MATTPATAEIDLFADDILIDPYPAFAALRDLGAVVHLPANDVYALTRYDAIRDALGDPVTFSSVKAIGFNPGVNEALQGTSLASVSSFLTARGTEREQRSMATNRKRLRLSPLVVRSLGRCFTSMCTKPRS